MTLKCCIIDDEPLALNLMESYVQKTPFLELSGKYSSAVEAMQYAIDGYKVNALDYLLKPISYTDFLQAANKALHWFELLQQREISKQENGELESIFVKSDYKLIQVELKNILYIEGLKDYIKIYEENAPRPLLSLMSLKAMEELLPTEQFIRVHRSYIVRKDKIRFIDRGRIVFGKNYIPISDSYKPQVQAFIDKHSKNERD